MTTAATKLTDARILLLMHEPWYGHAAMMFNWSESQLINTMGVRVDSDHQVQCLYNPWFVKELTLLELCSVIKHEVEHVVRCHCQRADRKQPVLWNIAADMVVNGPKLDPRIGFRVDPKSDPTIPMAGEIIWIPETWGAHGTTEQYFLSTKRNSREPEIQTILVGLRSGGLSFDDHDVWLDTNVSVDGMEAIARTISRQASEKSRGAAPGHLKDYLSTLGQQSVRWHTHFRRLVRSQLPDRRSPSFARRNRRRDEFGIPGNRRVPDKPSVSVVIDVSGSIGKAELQSFFAEVEQLSRHARVDVLQWDWAHQGFHRGYRKGDWKTIKIRGGGGTDMAAPVDWLREHCPDSSCTVIFTDGYCNWPKRQRNPLISVITSDATAPDWIRSIHLKIG